MPSDLLLHLDQPLDQPTRSGLLQSITAQFGLSVSDAHPSHQAHLLFVPMRLGDVRPQQLLDFVRAKGYSAQIVDL